MNNFLELLKQARSAGQPCFVYLADSDESVVVLTLEEYKKLKGNVGIAMLPEPARSEVEGAPHNDDVDFSPSKLIADLSKARSTKALADIGEPDFNFENLDELDVPAGEELTAADVLRNRAKKLSGNLKKKREGAFPGEQAEEW